MIGVFENQTSAIDVQTTDDNDSEGAGLTYGLTGGADQALFSIDSNTGEVTFIAPPDFENPGDADGDNAYEVQVTVTDSAGLTDVQDFTITVTDVDEGPASAFLFTYLDAAADTEVLTFADGDFIDASLVAPGNRSIAADLVALAGTDFGSVRFSLEDANGVVLDTRLENAPAFVLTGNTGTNFFLPAFDFADGAYALTVTAFDANGGFDGPGDVIASETVAFTIEEVDLPSLEIEFSDGSLVSESGAIDARVTREGDLSEDLLVTLLGSDPGEASVPMEILIPAGTASAVGTIFGVSDGLVDGDQPVTVSASAPGFAGASGVITVEDDDTSELSVTADPAIISEGAGAGAATGTVTLTTPFEDDLVVSLSSDDPTEATVPVSVVIPGGATSADFDIDAVDDPDFEGGGTFVTITASTPAIGSDQVLILVEDDEGPSITISIDPSSISENGGIATGTVSTDIPGGLAAALEIDLVSSDTTEAVVPASVIIPMGAESATFQITAVDDADPDGDQDVTITGSAMGFASGVDVVTVTDDDAPGSDFVFSFLDAGSDAVIQTFGDGDVIDGALVAPGNRSIAADLVAFAGTDFGSVFFSLEDENGVVDTQLENAAAFVLTGNAGPDFFLPGFDFDNGDYTLTVTAFDANGGFGGGGNQIASETIDFSIEEDVPDTLSLSIIPDTATEGDGPSTGMVSRSGSTAGALEVTLTSDDTSEATVPATVTIPDGAASAAFDVTIIDDALVDGAQSAAISAAATGFDTVEATVTVLDDDAPVVTELEVVVSDDGEANGAGPIDATQAGGDNDLEIGGAGGDITGLLFDDVEIAFGATIASATLLATSQRSQSGSREIEIGLSADTEGQTLVGPIVDHFDFSTTETVSGFFAADAEVAFDVTGIVNALVSSAEPANTDGTYDLNFALQTDGQVFRINPEEFGEDNAARLILEFV